MKAVFATCRAIFLLFCLSLSVAQAQPRQQVLHGHLRPAVTTGQAKLIAPLEATQQLNLSIVLPLRNQAELTDLLSRLYDPSSPDYRHFLSVEQFTEEFGPTAEDYDAVVAFAQANGFVVTERPANRLIVPIRATVDEIDNAFNLKMNVYQHPTEDRTFYSPDREPSLDLSVPVSHIAGLDNFSLPRPMTKTSKDGVALAAITGSGPGGSYLGSDMRAAYYGGTTLTGEGQAVGLLEFGGYDIGDVELTFSSAGQTYIVPVNNVLLDGATDEPEGYDTEQVLDIVQAIGMAPGLSQVRVYIGTGQDDANIFNEMASENIAKQISVSWDWSPEDPTTDDVFFEEFAAQGQSVFVASGDDGAFDAGINPYFYPAEDDYVTSVGGTHLTTNGAGGDWVSEAVWNSEGYGSGGGISPDNIAIPSWQTGVATSANGGSTTLRNEPDVAMEGDFDNYYCALGSCGDGEAGTSFAAPRWAGFMALVNQQAVEAGNASSGGIGSINPAIYAIGAGSDYSSDFHDITSGNNQTGSQPVWFSATQGYDLTTGWGSPNGQSLIDALAGPQLKGFWLASSVGTLNIALGSSGTSTITVTDAGGFSGGVTLAVTSGLPSGVTASWETNPTTGTSVLTLTASSAASTVSALVTITGTSGSLTETTSFTVSIHGPSFTLAASPVFLSIAPGATGTSTITVGDLYGFTGAVKLAVTSGLPAGVTASWGTNPTSGSSVLTLTASSNAVGGTANLTITGTSGSLTATTYLSLAITAPTFTLFASPSQLSLGQGSSTNSVIFVNDLNGFNGSVHLAVTSPLPSGVAASWSLNPTTGTSVLTLTASSNATLGQYSLTVTGTSGTLTATTTLALGVYAPTFSLSANNLNIGQGTSGSTPVFVNALYGFTGTVNLSVSGLPSGVSASFSSASTTEYSNLVLTATSTAAVGQYTLTVTGTSGSLTKTTTFTLGVYAPTFSLSAYDVNIGQGSSAQTNVYVSQQYGFSGTVSFSLAGLPAGVTASFIPNPAVGSTTLTLTASNSATIGQSTVTVTGTSGSITQTTTFVVAVYAPTFTIFAPSQTIGQGSSVTSYVNVSPQYGFAGTVKLAVSGLPNGVSASFVPNPTVGSSVMTLTATGTAAIGQSTITVTGTSGSLTRTTTFTLGVYAPGFTLSTSSATVGQGSSTTSYVSVNPQYGFTGSVTLSASGLPSGVTATFAPNPTTGQSTFTLIATSAAAAGQYSVTISGVSGSLTQTTSFALGVNAPTFTLSASGVNIGQGSSAISYVNVNSQYGFTGNVAFSITGQPAGVTAAFTQSSGLSGSTLTLTASNSAALGQYNAAITGKSGSLTVTTPVSIGVYAQSFTLSAGGLNLGQGHSATSSVSVSPQYGFAGNVALTASGLPSGITASFAPGITNGISTMTLTASNSVPVGQYGFTVTGVSGNLNASTTSTVAVFAPSFTLYANNVNVAPGGSGTTQISAYPQYGFAGNITLSASGLPTGVTAAFSPNPTSGDSTLTLTAASSVAPGQYTITITGVSGTQSASTTLALGVNTSGFTVSAYGGLNVGQGSSGTFAVYVSPQNGFNGNVTLSISGLPSGVTASFAPNPTSGTSILTLTASSSATLGQYNAVITGTSGAQTASTAFPVGVYAEGFTLNASPVNIGRSTTGTSSISVSPQFGFTGEVMLSVSGLPAGVTASFIPNPTNSASTLVLTASSSASLGQYNVTITGTSGSLTSSTIFTLGVYVPSFTLSMYNGVDIGQGSYGTTYVYVTPQDGFTGNVRLSASGLPAGVTATFAPSPTVGSSLVTLTASSSASLGQYNVTITGTSGGLTQTATFTLGVYAPTFTLSANSVNIGQGSTTTSNVYVNGQNGFTGSVNLALSGLPAGVTASLSPTPTTGNSTVTFTATGSATPGQYSVTVIGTSGTQTATTSFILGVNAPSFSLSAYNVSIGQGTSTTNGITIYPQYGFIGNVALSISGLPPGVTAAFTPNPTPANSTLTLTASSSAILGEYNVTVTGTSGALTATSAFTLGVYAPTFTLSANSANISPGSSATSAVYVYPQNGFTGNVTLSASGLPSGVTASFSPNPTNGNSTVTLTASSTAPVGQYSFTVAGTSGTQTVTTLVSLGIYAPSFTLFANNINVSPGNSSNTYVYISSQFGFTGNVTLSASGLPAGVTAAFSPNPATSNSNLTLTAGSSVVPGQYIITITGTSGTQTVSTTLTLGVSVPGFYISTYGGLNIGLGSSGSSYVYIYSQNGFTGSVTLSISGLPSGVTGSFSPNPTNGTSLLTLTASSSAALGQYNAIITGTSGSQTATTALPVGVYSQGFTLVASNVTIGRSSTATTSVSVNPQYGFTGAVTLAVSGLPTGVTAAWGTNPTTGNSLLTLTAGSAASLGQYNVAVSGTSGGLTSTAIFTLGVYEPTFTVNAYSGGNIGQGSSATASVSISPQFGFTGNVALSVSGLPAGVSASFSPNPTTGNSTLKLTASTSASLGLYSITVTGTSSGMTSSSTFNLEVFASTFTISSYANVNVSQGNSSTAYVYVSPQFAFTGLVSLSASGLPAGVTASFSPTSISNGSSVLTLTASSTAAAGAATVTITGTSGSLTASTTLLVAVIPNQATPTITWSSPPAINYGTALTASQLNATASVPGTLTYSPPAGTVPDGGVQALSVTLTPTNTNAYTSVTKTVPLTVNRIAQSITFVALPTQTFGTTPFTLNASASSGLAVSFTSIAPAVCTIYNSTVTLNAGGTCTIEAMQPGDADYTAAPIVTQSFTVNKASQTITFATIPTQAVGTPLSLSASASSGLTVIFSSITGSRCTISGTTATFIESGTCTIVAEQTGNAAYTAAPEVSQSFSVKQTQIITFGTISTQTVGTQLTLSAKASSGLAVSFVSLTTSECTVSGTTATLVATGTCSIQASQSGNSSYSAAPAITQSFTVSKASQTITFANPGTQAIGTPLTLSATASSGLAVTYSSITGSRCTVSGNTATFLEAGTCIIYAEQTGNSNYSAATEVSQSFAVKDAQTITFANPGAQTVGKPLMLSATASSGLAVTFSSTATGQCTVSGNTVTFVATGTCSIVAMQAGNSTYAAAPTVSQSFTVGKGSQTITFNNPGTQTVGTPLALTATASSGLTVTYSSITGSRCTVSGNTATFLEAGTCIIYAEQSGNSAYTAAPEVPQSFTVNAN